jgi:hypothetical protein
MGKDNKFTTAEMIDAIETAEGNLSDAARYLGCVRQTVHNYVNKFVTVRQAYDNANEQFLDECEGQLRKLVRRGVFPAVVFALKTKGKSRGYVERQEIATPKDQPLQIEYVNDWRDKAALSASGAANSKD